MQPSQPGPARAGSVDRFDGLVATGLVFQVLDLLERGELATTCAPRVVRVPAVSSRLSSSNRAARARRARQVAAALARAPQPVTPLGIPSYRSGQMPALVGCAVPFGQPARVRGGTEVVWEGAFSGFLSASPRVVARVNHRDGQELGSTSDGRLQLEQSAAGLMFRLELPPGEALSRAVLGAARRRHPGQAGVVDGDRRRRAADVHDGGRRDRARRVTGGRARSAL